MTTTSPDRLRTRGATKKVRQYLRTRKPGMTVTKEGISKSTALSPSEVVKTMNYLRTSGMELEVLLRGKTWRIPEQLAWQTVGSVNTQKKVHADIVKAVKVEKVDAQTMFRVVHRLGEDRLLLKDLADRLYVATPLEV